MKISKVSIIVPCFNEKKTIKILLDKVNKFNKFDKEIIIVDDKSTDGTREIIENDILNNYNEVKLIKHSKNKGKGAAIKTAIKEVTGEIIIIQDADLEYDPSEYEKLLNPILHRKADVVYGSRFCGGEQRIHLFWHKLANNFLTLLCNILTNLNLSDMETCYKVFKTEIIKKIDLKENRFGIEPELTIKLAREKSIFYEVCISYYGRSYDEGKKIGFKDGLAAIYCILRYSLFK